MKGLARLRRIYFGKALEAELQGESARAGVWRYHQMRVEAVELPPGFPFREELRRRGYYAFEDLAPNPDCIVEELLRAGLSSAQARAVRAAVEKRNAI